MAKTKTAAKSESKTKAKPKAANKKTTAGDTEVTVCRRRNDRRESEQEDDDRAAISEVSDTPATPPIGAAPPTERRKVPRRRQIDPTTCERDYTDDEIEFMHALDAYKRSSGRMFPTCSEILEVVRGIGYFKLTPEELAAYQEAPPTPEEAIVEPAESAEVS